MGHLGIRTHSVFSAPSETIRRARRYCARQVVDGKLTPAQLRDVLFALGLDATAKEDIPIVSGAYYARDSWNG